MHEEGISLQSAAVQLAAVLLLAILTAAVVTEGVGACQTDEFSDGDNVCHQCAWCRIESPAPVGGDPMTNDNDEEDLHRADICRRFAAGCPSNVVTPASPTDRQVVINVVDTAPARITATASPPSTVRNLTSATNATPTDDGLHRWSPTEPLPAWAWVLIAVFLTAVIVVPLAVCQVLKMTNRKGNKPSGETTDEEATDKQPLAPVDSQAAGGGIERSTSVISVYAAAQAQTNARGGSGAEQV